MQHISSRQNPIVARYRAAREREHEIDPVLLDGVHLVSEAIDRGAALRDVVVAERALERAEMRELLSRLARARVDVKTAAPTVMSALSSVRSPSPIVALIDRPGVDETRVFAGAAPLVAIAADVQDPGNVGAIVRVAEAAGATGVVVAGQSADPFGWKAVRGSMGSALRLPVHRALDASVALAVARRHGCRVFATIPHGGRPLFATDLTKGSAVLIGGEGSGLPDSLISAADERITVPMQAPVESLNAAVTAAVILYEAHRQRSA